MFLEQLFANYLATVLGGITLVVIGWKKRSLIVKFIQSQTFNNEQRNEKGLNIQIYVGRMNLTNSTTEIDEKIVERYTKN